MEWLVDLGILKRKRRYALWGDAREQVARSLVRRFAERRLVRRAVHGRARAVRRLGDRRCEGSERAASAPRAARAAASGSCGRFQERDGSGAAWCWAIPASSSAMAAMAQSQCRIEGDALVMVQTQHSAPDQPYWGELRDSLARKAIDAGANPKFGFVCAANAFLSSRSISSDAEINRNAFSIAADADLV